METITGIKNLKIEYIKAKLVSGCLKGLKEPCNLAERHNIDPMMVMYFASGGKAFNCEPGGKTEIETEVSDSEDDIPSTVWNLKDLLQEIKDKENVYIVIKCNCWNKYRNEVTDKKTIKEFIFHN